MHFSNYKRAFRTPVELHCHVYMYTSYFAFSLTMIRPYWTDVFNVAFFLSHSKSLSLFVCFPFIYISSFPHSHFSPLLCPPSLPLFVFPFTELLRHHRTKASQTSRQATDALHAVQPEGKQEGKTPIHGVCFYCLSSHPLKSYRGIRVGNSQAMTPPPHHSACGDSPLCYPVGLQLLLAFVISREIATSLWISFC